MQAVPIECSQDAGASGLKAVRRSPGRNVVAKHRRGCRDSGNGLRARTRARQSGYSPRQQPSQQHACDRKVALTFTPLPRASIDMAKKEPFRGISEVLAQLGVPAKNDNQLSTGR